MKYNKGDLFLDNAPWHMFNKSKCVYELVYGVFIRVVGNTTIVYFKGYEPITSYHPIHKLVNVNLIPVN